MIPFLLGLAAALFRDARGPDSDLDRFGAEPSSNSDAPTPSPLHRVRERLRALNQAATEPALAAVADLDREVERNVRTITRSAPAQLTDLVQGVVTSALEQAKDSGVPVTADVMAMPWLTMTPTDAEEAGRMLGAIESALGKSPEVKRVVDGALHELERLDLLGRGALSTVTSLLLAAAGGAVTAVRTVAGVPVVLRGPGFQVSADTSGQIAAKLRATNPLWARQAVEVALSVDVTPGSGRFVESGSVKVPITVVQGPRTKVTLSPYASASEKERRVGVEAGVRF